MNTHMFPALRQLSDTEFRSGEDIAERLGVTRATVWNALNEAQSLGVEMEKMRGLGYRLLNAPVWLDGPAIMQSLRARVRQDFAVEVLECVDSTNGYLMMRAASGAASGTTAIAELQTAGRGRRGRSWLSGLGGAMTFSTLWRFDQSVASLSGLSLVVGLAVAAALKSLEIDQVGLKWPNDIVIGEQKLGGVLIELQGDALGPSAAIIGIGLNVRLPVEVQRKIDQPVIDLAALNVRINRNELAAVLLAHLIHSLERFTEEGYSVFEPDYRRFHVLQEKEVSVLLPDGNRVTGVVSGTAADGALLLDTAQGVRRFHGGEVSVRKHGTMVGSASA